MFGRLPLLLSVELLVLIAAIFLLVYITKQQVSKWFTYGTAAIVVTILGMMICTVCCTFCYKHCGQNRMENECRFEDRGRHKMTMLKMRGDADCSEEMMRDRDCKMGNESEMKKECCKDKGGMMKEMVVDSLPKKK